MTDTELVERVAREVMGWDDVVHYTLDRLGLVRTSPDNIGITFDPLTDMNDLQLVKDKLRETGWEIESHIHSNAEAMVYLFSGDCGSIHQQAATEAHAILQAALLQAALKAKGGRA